jgi:hypothetical protein
LSVPKVSILSHRSVIALAGDFAGVEQQVDVVPLDDVARGVAQLGAWVERGTVALSAIGLSFLQARPDG